MPMLEAKSRAYQERIEAAIFEAIVKVSMVEDGKTAALLSGEIVQACLNVIAMMAGTSEVTASPTRSREFGDECAKAIRARAVDVRRRHAAGELAFMSVTNAGERH